MDNIQERLEHYEAKDRERREINHNEFLAIFKKSIPEENEK